MFDKKLLISLVVFSTLMILTSLVKTETRLIQKRIDSLEKKISIMKNNFHESQIDYSYLSSPDYISKKIMNYGNEEYFTIKYSQIYFSLDQFLNEQKKLSNIIIYEKKK